MADKISGNTDKLSYLSDAMDNIVDKVESNTKKLSSYSDLMDSIKDKTRENYHDIALLEENVLQMLTEIWDDIKKLKRRHRGR